MEQSKTKHHRGTEGKQRWKVKEVDREGERRFRLICQEKLG